MKRTLTLLALLMAGMLAACGPQPEAASEPSGLQTWLDAPADGSLLPQAVYTIVFSGANLHGSVDSFELVINGAPESVIPAQYQGSQAAVQYGFGMYAWSPPAPGIYLIEVRTLSSDQAGAYAAASVVVGEIQGDEQASPAGAPQMPQATGANRLVAIPDQNANCRYGNSSQWDIADTLFEGVRYGPLGRGTDNQWVLFRGPATNLLCWAFVGNLSLLVDEADTDITDIPEALLPFVAYPATPTPSPSATFTPEPSATPEPTRTRVP